MELCREIGALYIDTVVEPWPGFYFDTKLGPEARSNYALRETMLAAKRARKPGGTTAVSCCGANPGMVSWFVKQALLNVAGDTRPQVQGAEDARGLGAGSPRSSASRASTSPSATPSAPSSRSRMDVFVNTWSVEGFISEGMQPAELGWGTHEKWMPDERPQAQDRLPGGDLSDAARRQHARALVDADGAARNTASWSPTTSRSRSPTTSRCARAARSIYRPTCHYAYHPCNDAVLSLHEMFGQAGKTPGRTSTSWTSTRSSTASTNSACCSTATRRTPIGTARSSRSTRRATLAPYQNATGLQVTSAVLAGMVWALENPKAGIVEADEMDFRRCLEVQMPYLGPVIGAYTDWTPLTGRPGLFPEEIDKRDPWQFRNVLVR